MANKASVTVRDAMNEAIETAIGTAPILKIRTGAPPTDIVDADSGTVLVSLTLPSDWLAASASGSKALLGTWQGTAIAAGTAGHYRLYTGPAGTVQHLQGTVTATGGGGDMTLTNAVIAVDDVITVDTFTIVASNA